MARLAFPAGAAVLAVIVGCSDLATVPARTPTQLRILQDVVTTTEGSSVTFDVEVLDGEGEPIDIPEWAPVRWSVSSPAVISPLEDGVRAEAPGAATATAAVAGLEGSATVRVNPSSLKLEIAHVQTSQDGNTRSQLDPDTDTRIDIFLTGDAVNFFRPEVRVSVLRQGSVEQVLTLLREDESIPQSFDPADPSRAWSATIPGELIKPGAQIVVEADPSGTIPRSTGSRDRFPESGSFTLDVRAPALQIVVEGAYLTQSVQTPSGSVPLVAGRDALLRVFAVADEESPYRAAVQVTVYNGSAPVHTTTLRRSESIPVSYDEGVLTTTWNGVIPGNSLVAGGSLVVEVDPEGAFSMKEGSRPRYPATGRLSLDIRPVPRLWLRMIPIFQTSQGTLGTINSSNIGEYVSAVTAKFPIEAIDADLRNTYVTTASATTDSGWQQILREIEALRRADNSGRYYYGVLRLPTGSPWGGLGYVGWPAAIGHDRMPTGPETFAHEIGHNFSLRHAPCGNPNGPDPAFPYSDGSIGVFGYDARTRQLRSPAEYKDLMSYCSPEWISDFSYNKAMEFRDRWDWTTTGPDAAGSPESSLLVWGGVDGGQLVLEPAFELEMATSLPSGDGAYRIQGLEASGAEIFSYRFNPNAIDHTSGGANFAFSIPSRITQPDRLARLRLTGPEGEVVRERLVATGAAAAVEAERIAGRLELSWAATWPMVLIRDRVTGEVISFARDGAVDIPDRPVDVLISDGVRSVPANLPNF